MTGVHWLAFGDLDAGVWGLAWIPDDAGAGHAALGTGGGVRVVEAELDPRDDWRLGGDGLELTISGAGEKIDADGGGFAQLASASGEIAADGSDRTIATRAWRATLADVPELDSLRLLAAWFGADEGLALLAIRPRRARGQEGDLVSAALVEEDEPRSVSDPRLSTTYTGEGIPSRAGAELWVSEPTGEGESVRERPHRVAGEAAGPLARWTEGSIELGVQPFRWHSHGRDGSGVYLLGQAA